MFFKNLLTFF
jgi:WD40 repeat protein